jgi:hypothetical protein
MAIGINPLGFYEISQSLKIDEFKANKKRANIEGKNAELNRRYS